MKFQPPPIWDQASWVFQPPLVLVSEMFFPTPPYLGSGELGFPTPPYFFVRRGFSNPPLFPTWDRLFPNDEYPEPRRVVAQPWQPCPAPRATGDYRRRTKQGARVPWLTLFFSSRLVEISSLLFSSLLFSSLLFSSLRFSSLLFSSLLFSSLLFFFFFFFFFFFWLLLFVVVAVVIVVVVVVVVVVCSRCRNSRHQ